MEVDGDGCWTGYGGMMMSLALSQMYKLWSVSVKTQHQDIQSLQQ